MNQRGVIHLLIPLLVLIIGVCLVVLVYFGLVKNPVSNYIELPTQSQRPTVSLKADYQNPFKKETQYVNPFDQYKSPLLNLKQ